MSVFCALVLFLLVSVRLFYNLLCELALCIWLVSLACERVLRVCFCKLTLWVYRVNLFCGSVL